MNSNQMKVVKRAIGILDRELKSDVFTADESSKVKDYLRLKLELCEREVFGVLFLNNANQLIEYNEMFSGTVDKACIYPREVAKRALLVDATSLIIAHNHPAGTRKISHADRQITMQLQRALELFDINILDHFIVCKGHVMSFAEEGII